MNCDFEGSGSEYKCKVCGYTFKRPVNRKCGPSGIKRATNFVKAVVNHTITGAERVSQDEIDRRYEICKECPLFSDGICKHNSCGCNISNVQKFLNKLAWKDQQCPLDKWRIY